VYFLIPPPTHPSCSPHFLLPPTPFSNTVVLPYILPQGVVPENIHTPPPLHRRDWTEIPGRVGGEESQRPKKLKQCMKLNLTLWWGEGGGDYIGQILSVEEGVWIFSGTT